VFLLEKRGQGANIPRESDRHFILIGSENDSALVHIRLYDEGEGGEEGKSHWIPGATLNEAIAMCLARRSTSFAFRR